MCMKQTTVSRSSSDGGTVFIFVDHVPQHIAPPNNRVQLVVFEMSSAVIEILEANMRHVSRPHRVHVD